MPEGGLERRLERIESRQDTMLEKLAIIHEKVTSTNGSVEDLLAEVGRVPALTARAGRLSVTDRLHSIESVVTPVAMEAAMIRALDKRRSHGWTAMQKSLLFVIALAGAIEGALRLFGVGG